MKKIPVGTHPGTRDRILQTGDITVCQPYLINLHKSLNLIDNKKAKKYWKIYFVLKKTKFIPKKNKKLVLRPKGWLHAKGADKI